MLVKARVSKRDDRVSLIANDLAVPDLQVAGEENSSPVAVSLAASRCTPPPIVAKLKDVLHNHPGTRRCT